MSPLYFFIFTKAASTVGFLVVAGIIFLFLITNRRVRTAKVFLLATLGLMISVEVLKDIFRVSRPAHALIEASGYALPSGHAAGTIFLACMLSYFATTLKKPLRYGVYVASGLTVLAIGASRLQLGVHTLFQIYTGYALGAFIALVCIVVIKRS